MSSPPTVLIFTYSEHGQANVVLATSYELALAGVNVCIASFAPLGARISRLQELIARHAPSSSGKPTGSVTFRECRGVVTSHGEAIVKRGVTSVEHPHGVSGALKGYSMLNTVLLPWSLEEYLAIVESCKDIIATTKNNLVVVEILFIAALDACKVMDQKFMVILPNSLDAVAMAMQPGLTALWKYPALSSGFPFPLRWWQIPLNVYLNIRLAIRLMIPANGKIQRFRRSLGFTTIYGKPPSPGVKCICPALPEIDFPLAIIPEEIFLSGPITLPFDPVAKADPALKKWLDNGPTVLINLGSHVTSDKVFAREMTGAFRVLLDYHAQKSAGGIQVLWKVKPSEDIQPVIDETIGKEIKQGKVKVLPWLDVEPISILQHPNVVCTVHHGGANSFCEGIWSGLPHVVLPVWFDTYQYARLAEFLNVGIFGNKSCAPSVRAEELGEALARVTGYTDEAARLGVSARRLRELCRAKGNGRQLSAEAILKEAGIRR